MASSSLRPWGCGHPHHPTMERCVVGCYCSPWPQRPRFPYPEASRAPKPPGPAASSDPLAVLKHDVAAQRPVDVQVYLRDVLGGDKDVLLHFLWENRGGGAGIRETDPDFSRAAVLGREPWGHHGSVSCRNLLPSPGRPGLRQCPRCPWDLCEGLCPAVVGEEVT